MIKPAYSLSFLLSINIFVWQNDLYFPNDPHMYMCMCVCVCVCVVRPQRVKRLLNSGTLNVTQRLKNSDRLGDNKSAKDCKRRCNKN